MAKNLKKVILLGPQGSGKSTQSQLIANFLRISILAAGGLLRSEMKKQTELGKKIANFVNNGEMIPDSLMISLVLNELKKPPYKDGWLLDGFPRNLNQAANLDQHYRVDRVFNIDIPDKLAIERIAGRRICPNGHVFHVDHAPSDRQDICDICHQVLYYRPDDQPSLVEKRLAFYRQETTKLLEYYKQQDKLIAFDGRGSIPEVSKLISDYLQNYAG